MCTGVATGVLELQDNTPVGLNMVQLDYRDEIKTLAAVMSKIGINAYCSDEHACRTV